jgi:hypothetical protein
MYNEPSYTVALPECFHLLVRHKLTTPRLFQPLLDSDPFFIGWMIQFAFLGFQHQQHVRGILLALERPGQNAVKNVFDLRLGHNPNSTI